MFIEGDAIILSIFETEDTIQGNYSVARACGLAIRILQIVHSYNEKNKENNDLKTVEIVKNENDDDFRNLAEKLIKLKLILIF